MINAVFWALALQMETALASPTLPAAAPPGSDRSPEEQFGLDVRNLFELVARPDPRYDAFVSFDDRSRVIILRTRGGGLARVVEAAGDQGSRALTETFGPQSGVSFAFGVPELQMDGAFGRAKMAITITETGKRPQCASAYIDGILLSPGKWAKYARQGIWRFSQIVITSHFDGKCPS